MTVNELIAELQVLATQGHGDLDVAISTPYDDATVKFEVLLSSSDEDVRPIYWTGKEFSQKEYVALNY